MCFSWPDSTKDAQHKPYVWNKDSGFYETGKQREDRFAVSLMMAGDYDVNPTSGKEFKADIWHWKAARTNPVGLAHDKYWVISRKLPAKEGSGITTQAVRTGGKIGMYRRSDKGSKIYGSVKKPKKYLGDVVAKYRPRKDARGSIADVKAKGVWKKGRWTLEISRLLDTGNPDDRAIRPGSRVRGAIAVFDHRGDNHHSNSEELHFQF